MTTGGFAEVDDRLEHRPVAISTEVRTNGTANQKKPAGQGSNPCAPTSFLFAVVDEVAAHTIALPSPPAKFSAPTKLLD